ncbi:hypothetical protein V2G26_010091 [Clonostachys chloroleuca]
MSSIGNVPLAKMDPRPMSSPSLANLDGPVKPTRTSSVPNIALKLGPESQIPDHPHSMNEVPRASNNYATSPGYRGPGPHDGVYDSGYGGGGGYGPVANAGYAPAPMMTSVSQLPSDVPSLKSRCQFQLQEYLSLQRKRQRAENSSKVALDLESRIRSQQGMVLNDLVALQAEVKAMVKSAENHRWRKWLLGGAIASFIPLVRRIFRRGDDEASLAASNDTEYAFNKSKGLLDYIKEGVLGNGSFAKIAFFVFAVLYVFQNEVSLRVARTMHKRIKRLVARVEMGDTELDERDIKILDGWRWRILLW